MGATTLLAVRSFGASFEQATLIFAGPLTTCTAPYIATFFCYFLEVILQWDHFQFSRFVAITLATILPIIFILHRSDINSLKKDAKDAIRSLGWTSTSKWVYLFS